MCINCYSPPWVWLDLLSTLVLTLAVVASVDEDTDFVAEDVE
jgi:hypothetical protein